MNNRYSVVWATEDGKSVPYLHVRLDAPHTQVLPSFGKYSMDSKSPDAIVDYGNPRNITGHQQRAYVTYWAIRSYIEHNVMGIEVGSAGVPAPFCLNTDVLKNGQEPVYGGTMQGVQVAVDANDLALFESDAFGCILSNHVLEHAHCSRLVGGETQEQKLAIACDGSELVSLFDEHWLRVIKHGGYCVAIFPDERPSRKVGSSSLYHDKSHHHFFYPEVFKQSVLDRLITPVEIVEFDTLGNNFSINLVLRKT